MKNFDELKSFYEALPADFEGFCQMSDEATFAFDKLPEFSSLFKGRNFINEMHLFSEKTQESIVIRHFNEGFLCESVNLGDFADKEIEIYLGKNDKKVKIAQIWVAEKDALCEDFEVLKLKFSAFAGFIKGDENE